MKKTDKLSLEFKKRLEEWEKSQEGQTSGYEYERSFAELMRQLSEETFEQMVGTSLTDKNKKKP